METGIADSGSSDEFVVVAGASLVRVGAEFVTELDGPFVEAAVVGVASGVDVSTDWLHPLSDKPTSALAAAIWIFRNNLILFILSNGELPRYGALRLRREIWCATWAPSSSVYFT